MASRPHQARMVLRSRAGLTIGEISCPTRYDDDSSSINMLVKKIRDVIRTNTTPRHVPAVILQVPDIPRTKSNKIVELAVRAVVHGQPVKNVEALANPEALEHFRNRGELAS